VHTQAYTQLFNGHFQVYRRKTLVPTMSQRKPSEIVGTGFCAGEKCFLKTAVFADLHTFY